MITQDDNLILQSYYNFVLFAELTKNDFFKSDYFKKMKFDNPPIKDGLEQIGIDNQGLALISLYTMLVVPKEIYGKKYQEENDNINEFLKVHTQNTQTTYARDSPNIDFLGHIRNAVAHARVSFEPTKFVTFSDEYRGKSFTTELPLKHLGEFIHILQRFHLRYIQEIQQR